MLISGQTLSSTSGPGHWLSSSLKTGRPESRSKQARKRFWTETIFVPLTTPSVRSCSEGLQGEQGVHSDHSLRTAEWKKAKSRAGLEGNEVMRTYETETSYISFLTFLPSHSLISQWKVPLWQRLEKEKQISPIDTENIEYNIQHNM